MFPSLVSAAEGPAVAPLCITVSPVSPRSTGGASSAPAKELQIQTQLTPEQRREVNAEVPGCAICKVLS